MKKILPRNILKPLTLLTIVAALASCTDDFLLPETPSDKGENDGRIHFSVLPPASAEVEMMSRAAIPATDPEKAIYTLRIIIFDGAGNIIPDDAFKLFDNSFTTTVFGSENIGADGKMKPLEQCTPFNANEGFSLPVFTKPVYYSVTTTNVTAEDGTQTTTHTTTVLGTTEPADFDTPPDGTQYFCLDPSDAENLKKCQIWVLANMGRWENSLVNHTADNISSLDDIRTLDDLRRFYGKRQTSDFAANRPFLPMVGTISGETEIPVVDPESNSEIIKQSGGTSPLKFSDIFGSDAAVEPPTGYSYAAPGTLDLTTPSTIGKPEKILMNQIVAKVRFNITMPKAKTSTTEGDLTVTDESGTPQNVQSLKWEFYFDNWTVENLPRYTYIIPHRKDIADYVQNETYSQAAFSKASAENDFLQAGLYMPNEGDEPAAFEHNGFGDGESTGDWIGPGKSSPNAVAAADGNEGSYIYSPTEGQYYYHFYTYGNRRGGRGEAKVSNLSGTTTNYGEYSMEDRSENQDNELYKTLYAPNNATFLVLRGIVRRIYTDLSGVEHKESRSVCYKIALGCNRTDDYNVYRNTCYTLHIKINGFDQNDLQVTTDDNYNSSVHRRFQMAVRAPYLDMFDCHYDMRYVQFTGISDNTHQRDVRLRIYSTKEAAEDEIKTTDSEGNATVTGYGLENDGGNHYHGSEAVSWLKIGVHSVGDHDYSTVTDIEDTDQENIFADGNNEKTFCIHAEEYVKDYTENEPREAWLQIRQTYHGLSNVLESLSDADRHAGGEYLGVAEREINNDGTKETVYDVYFIYPIEQYPPIEVTYKYYDSDGKEQENTLLVERFEEYTMALDPGINQPHTEGLQWGWSRYEDNSQESNYGFYEFTPKSKPKDNTTPQNTDDDGLFNTPVIALLTQNTNDNTNKFTRYSCCSDFAARYCYDKGAGPDDDGDDHHDWYLPSIDELNGLTSAEKLKGYMNTYQSGNGVGTEDGPVFWSSTTYTDPDDYPDELKQYWYDYGRDGKTYGIWPKISGWAAARLKASFVTGDGVIYNTILGKMLGAKYSVADLREVWNYMETKSDTENERYPFNCAVASCNGMRYLEGYSRKWNADNSEVDGKLPPRSNTYRVRAVRQKPEQ